MASLQHRVPAALLALGLVAACGGDRSRPAAGTTRAAGRDDTRLGRDAADGHQPPPGASDASATRQGHARPGARGRHRRKTPPHPARTQEVAANSPRPAGRRLRRRLQRPRRPAPTAPRRPGGRPAAAAAPAPAAADTAKQDTARQRQDAAAESGGELRDAYHQAPEDTVSEAVYDGWKQFNLNCARCHGEDVQGTTIAPHLILSLKPDGPINTKELFMQTVCAGRPAKGMPAWCALGLGMDKISDIYQYVKGRSDAKISPGRPAVKRAG